MFGINDLRAVKKAGRYRTGVFSRQLRENALVAGGSCRKGIVAVFVFAAALLEPVVLHSSPNSSAAGVGGDSRRISDAFAGYVRATDARNNSELRRGTDLLWVDSLPQATQEKAYSDLRRGEIQLEQRTTRESGREIQCPQCMIHHWEGLVFIPGARLDDVLRVLEDYNHHAEYYAPDVARSQIEERDGDHFRVFLRFRRQKVITVVLNTEHEINYYRDSASGAHSRSSATHVAEVENPGKAQEREKPREEDNGFLWGMETWWRMEEKNNGVYVQSEVVSLSRDVPAGLGWMIGPFVTAVPKESLTFTLQATRKAVLARLRAKN
jgi:hypothetical protein